MIVCGKVATSEKWLQHLMQVATKQCALCVPSAIWPIKQWVKIISLMHLTYMRASRQCTHGSLELFLWLPRLNRMLIIHVNAYNQDQGLTGRYQNTTLNKNKIIQALYYKPEATRAWIHKLEYKRVNGSNNIWVHTFNKQVCLNKANTIINMDRKGKASFLGAS